MGRKLAWFVALYLGGLGAITVVAAVLRFWIGA